MIIVIGTVDLAPSQRQGFLDSQIAHIRATRAKAGCLTCAFTADPLESGRVLLLERWSSREAFDAHVAAGRAHSTDTRPDVIATVVSVSVCHVDEERWLGGWDLHFEGPSSPLSRSPRFSAPNQSDDKWLFLSRPLGSLIKEGFRSGRPSQTATSAVAVSNPAEWPAFFQGRKAAE